MMPHKGMRTVLAFFILAGLPSLMWAVQTPIYSVLTDAGSAGDDIYIWGPGGGILFSLEHHDKPHSSGRRSVDAGGGMAGQRSTWAIVYLDIPAPGSNRSVIFGLRGFR